MFTNPFLFDIFSILFFEFLFISVITTSFWGILKPVLEGKIKDKEGLKVLKKFKRDFSVFNSLRKEVPILDGFNELKGVHFGNYDASLQLTIIISPSCGHCHKAFQDAIDLVMKYPEKIFLNVLFNINPDNNENPYKKVVESLLTINNICEEKAKEAIIDWHINNISLEEWSEKWAVEVVDMKTNNQIYLQYNWCLKNKFNYTPLKLVNDTLFPNNFEISELKHFFNDFSKTTVTVENSLTEA